MLHGFDDIGLSVVKNLNSRILNISLSSLAENDTAILPPNDYIPKMWECKWYNNETIAGYQKGDIVWKWTMTSSEFLQNYSELIKKYAADNARLCGYFKDGLNWDDNPVEAQKYHNVISGYREENQIYGPLFDYCYDYKALSEKYAPRESHSVGHCIEIYISLSDDNKSALSDTSHWRNIAIKTKDELSSYLSSEMSTMIDMHINNFHLGGLKTKAEFEEVLLKRDLSNFDINKVYNALKVRDHYQYVNGQGVDYVVKVGKTSIPSHLSSSSDAKPTYKWFRRWSSGYLEHGGIIEIPKYDNSKTDISCYELSIKLDWIDGDISAEAYDYPIALNPIYGNQFDLIYYAKVGNDAIEESYDLEEQYLSSNHRYQIEITPITVDPNDISSNGKYLKFEQLSSLAYPQYANNDRNKTYVNFEVHKVKNDSFCIIRSNTDNLKDVRCPRYIQYYTCGYLAKPDRIYNFSSCIIKNLQPMYAYTGSPIFPPFEVITNDGEALVQGLHYVVDYGGSSHTEVGIVEFRIEAKKPYRGSILSSFEIGYMLDSTGFAINNIDNAYLYI